MSVILLADMDYVLKLPGYKQTKEQHLLDHSKKPRIQIKKTSIQAQVPDSAPLGLWKSG